MLFRAIGDKLVDLHHESTDQRAILRSLVKCVGDLKLTIDQLLKQRGA